MGFKLKEEIFYKTFSKEHCKKIDASTKEMLKSNDDFNVRIDQIRRKLVDLSNLKKEFRKLNPTLNTKSVYFLLLYHYFKSEAISSSLIENIPNPDKKSYVRKKDEVNNAKLISQLTKAYEYFFEKQDKIVLNNETLKRTHKELFNGIDQGDLSTNNTPGSFKTENNQVSIDNREPTIENSRTSLICIIKNKDEIDDLIENLNQETSDIIESLSTFVPINEEDEHKLFVEKIITVSRYLNFFLYYHPFIDGNGRIARLIFDYLVRKLKIYPEILPISKALSENLSLRRNFNESFIYFHYNLNYSKLTSIASEIILISLREKIEEYRVLIKRSQIINDLIASEKEEMISSMNVINLYYNKLQNSEILSTFQENKVRIPNQLKRFIVKDDHNNYYLNRKKLSYDMRQFEIKVVDKIND